MRFFAALRVRAVRAGNLHTQSYDPALLKLFGLEDIEGELSSSIYAGFAALCTGLYAAYAESCRAYLVTLCSHLPFRMRKSPAATFKACSVCRQIYMR